MRGLFRLATRPRPLRRNLDRLPMRAPFIPAVIVTALTLFATTFTPTSAQVVTQPYAATGMYASIYGVSVPAQINSCVVIGKREYENEHPGLGTSLTYRCPNAVLTLFIYNAGVAHLPDGISSPATASQFRQASSEVARFSPDAVASSTEPQVGELNGVEVAIRGWHLPSGTPGEPYPSTSWLLLTARNGHFVKLRLTISNEELAKNRAAGSEYIDSFTRQLASAPK
jgi:hypothetical protein